MKTIALALTLMLALISLSTTRSTSARVAGPSASGTYRFVEGDVTKQIEFSASWNEHGNTTGQMTFIDPAGFVEQEDDAAGDRPEGPPSELSVTADLDSLTIENNRALMGGTIRDSSYRSFIGRFVLLVVEDNGEGGEVPDKLTWRFCDPEATGWVPQDAEDPRDEGAWLSWWATDAERDDDRGVQSPNIIPGSRRGCPTSPLANYRFPNLRGEGQIQIHQ